MTDTLAALRSVANKAGIDAQALESARESAVFRCIFSWATDRSTWCDYYHASHAVQYAVSCADRVHAPIDAHWLDRLMLVAMGYDRRASSYGRTGFVFCLASELDGIPLEAGDEADPMVAEGFEFLRDMVAAGLHF